MRSFDDKMNAYCEAHGISYTRYSDDLTFSADEMDTGALIRFARATLREEGFALNFEKTRVLGAGAQHRVCGVVVNEKLSAPKAYRKRLRQEMHYLRKYPVREHIRRLNDPKFLEDDGTVRTEYYLRNLLGRIQYVNQLSPTEEFQRYASTVSRLLYWVEEYPENPACSGYLFGGEEELEREVAAIAVSAVKNPDKLLSLLIPDSAPVVQRLLAEGKLCCSETGWYSLGKTRISRMGDASEWEFYSFAYERTLRLLKDPAIRRQAETFDMLLDYLTLIGYAPCFPHSKFGELENAVRERRRQRCFSAWEKEKLRPDTKALEAEEPTREEAAVLCALMHFPEGVADTLADVIFENSQTTVERLVQRGWLEWNAGEGGRHLAIRPEAFLRFCNSEQSEWTWEKMSPFYEALSTSPTTAVGTSVEPLKQAAGILLRLLRLPGIPEEEVACCQAQELRFGISATSRARAEKRRESTRESQ